MTNVLGRLKRLSGQVNDNYFTTRTILTDDFVSSWNSKSEELIDNYKKLDNDSERKEWLRSFFMDVIRLLKLSEDNNSLQIDTLSELIKLVYNATPSFKQTIGEVFAAVVNTYCPKSVVDKVLRLITLTPILRTEVYKYSWLSTKLMTNDQKILTKHLLKKNRYEIKKYNLIYENPIGFTQITSLLNVLVLDPYAHQKIPYFVSQLYQIMGKYSLDPLRTLDVMITFFAEHVTLHYKLILDFLKCTNYWPRDTQLANPDEIMSLNHGGNKTAAKLITVRLNSFFQLAVEGKSISSFEDNYLNLSCLLIKEGFVNFSNIWSNLSPLSEEFKSTLDDYMKKLELESTKGLDNPLAMASALTNEDDEADNKELDNKDSDTTMTGTEEEDKELEEAQKRNFEAAVLNHGKLKLLIKLLAHGTYAPTLWAISEFPEISHLDTDIPILFSKLFEIQIENLYESMSFRWRNTPAIISGLKKLENGLLSSKPRLYETIYSDDTNECVELNTKRKFYYQDWSSGLPRIADINELVDVCHQYFKYFDVSLGCNSSLIIKLCRIVSAKLRGTEVDGTDQSQTLELAINYTRKFLLPIVGVMSENSTLGSEIFNLLKEFPLEKRYFMYNEMLTKTSQDNLLVKIGFNKAEREAKSILKSLSTDNIETGSRKFARLLSSNPLATLLPTIKQIENYDKVSELIIFTTKFLNQFGYDVLQYILLLRLTYSRPIMQDDGINQSMWVQRLAVFIAGLVKSCPQMDISELITYIIKQLHVGSSIAITIMKELISTVAGIRDLNHVSRERLILINSSRPLQKYGHKLIFDVRNENKSLGMKLMTLFQNQDAVSEIIVLLYNLNLNINQQDLHYKILSSKCDEMNTLLWSYIELVKYSNTHDNFPKYVYPFERLINEFHISTPWAFHIWRDYFKEEDEISGDLSNFSSYEKIDFPELSASNFDRSFFLTFWRLSLLHVQFDKNLYNTRKKEIESEIVPGLTNRQKNQKVGEKKEIMSSCITHEHIFIKTKKYLCENSSSWGNSLDLDNQHIFIKFCIVPRILFSPSDALFTSRFLIETFDNELLFSLMDTFIKSRMMHALIFCSTISEAANLGIFFADLFEYLEKARISGKLTDDLTATLYNWHDVLVEESIILLKERNYMSIRNGIEFLRNVSDIFPVVDIHIKLCCQALRDILEAETREDIKLPTNALLGHLNSKLKSSIRKSEYCQLTEDEKLLEEKYNEELNEIKDYETSLENEKKQAELRAKIEENKQKRLEAEKQKAELQKQQQVESSRETRVSEAKLKQKGQSHTWRLTKLFRVMDDVCYFISRNELNRAINLVEDDSEVWNIKHAIKNKGSLGSFRNNIFEIFGRYFKSLILYPQNSDFQVRMDELKAATKYLDRKSNDVEPEKSSRYGGSVKVPPGASAKSEDLRGRSTTPSGPASDKNKQSSNQFRQAPGRNTYNNDRQHSGHSYKTGKDDKEKTPQQRSQLQFPDRPTQGRNDHQIAGQKRGYQSQQKDSHDDHASKRFRKEDSSRMSYTDRNNRSFNQNLASRFGGPTNKNSNASSDHKPTALPQGPKGSSGSRYQR